MSDIEKLREALGEETLLLARSFPTKGETGYFFVSQRGDQFAPFRLGGYCPKEGIFEQFVAFVDFHAAKFAIHSLDIRA